MHAPAITHARFQVIRVLGSGSLGTVYEVEDLERQERVAAKLLHRGGSQSLYWLKREFRALADVQHPNLVTLHDLFAEGEVAFFTMELVEGKDLLQYCGRSAYREIDDSHDTLQSYERSLACDEDRLRLILPQLASGLDALHRAGKLHRDIKPTNIRVDPDDKLKILDFGLAIDRAALSLETMAGVPVGTAAYVSPEQALGDTELGPPSDWYSVGAVLYELLTGRLPFTGRSISVMFDKNQRDAVPPRQLVPDVPRDLDAICAELLERDPAQRPTAGEILGRLGATQSPSPIDALGSSRGTSDQPPFAGRSAELDALESALDHVAAGKPRAVLVRGPSGIGKTTLVRRFADHITRRTEVRSVVLSGRCYEREAVPFRAMDAVIDELSRYWRKLADTEAIEILPREPGRLRQLFPVLGRVPVIARHDIPHSNEDPDTQRTRSYHALRETFQRLGDRCVIVLVLDDLQWLDHDSVNLLEDLLGPPDPPRLLLVLTSRDYDPRETPALARLTEALRPILDLIEVAPLSRDERLALATSLIGRDSELTRQVADESEGNPFFLAELARYLATDSSATARADLDKMIAARVSALPRPSRQLLELVCVAGEPVDREVLRDALGWEQALVTDRLRSLRNHRLVRASASLMEGCVEPYHDRIREATLERVSEPVELHAALAAALEASGEASSDQLARHWRGAGELERAGRHAHAAGDDAASRTDFDRAARWYHLALELGPASKPTSRALWIKYAEAVGYAGRPLESANAYRRAIQGADRGTALELRRLAMEQLLGGGYLEQGMAVARELLAAVGVKLPATTRSVISRLIWQEISLRVRGLSWQRKPPHEVPAEALVCCDVVFTAGGALAAVDTFRSVVLMRHALLLALSLGDPYRVAQTVGVASGYASVMNKPRRAAELAAIAAKASAMDGSMHSRVWVVGSEMFQAYYLANDWTTTADLALEIFEILRDSGAGRSVESDAAVLFLAFSRRYGGDLRDLARDVPETIRAAARSGNRFLEISLRTAFSLVHLIADRPGEATLDVEMALQSWSSDERDTFHLQHWYALWNLCEAALYGGEPDVAERILSRARRNLRRSLFLRLDVIRVEYLFVRARIELAIACRERGNARKRRVASARKLARQMDRIRIPLGPQLAALVEAGAALATGARNQAASSLRDAILLLEAGQTMFYAHAARLRLGHLLDDASSIEESNDYFEYQGVAHPERMVNLFIPA